MKKHFAIATLSLHLIGCSTASKIQLPNGKQGYYVKCPRSMQNCYEKATEVCPNGYQVKDKVDSSTFVNNNGQLTAVKKFEMLVQCK